MILQVREVSEENNTVRWLHSGYGYPLEKADIIRNNDIEALGKFAGKLLAKKKRPPKRPF